ncbi:MAG TPA: DUF5691 domain-containing protein [Propionibacteriaceae bacterium]|nr:DUF5691 domain-containing protein [Propionibacteriaceae bacterium]
MTFESLASIAAVGTGQRSSLPSLGELAAYLPATDESAPEALAYELLDAAAALAVVRRGSPATAPGDPVPPAPADTRPEPPAHVVSLLGPLLGDDAGAIRHAADRVFVLREALGIVGAAGMRLPYRLLGPALARTDLRDAVRPVLGERGAWLMAQLEAASESGVSARAGRGRSQGGLTEGKADDDAGHDEAAPHDDVWDTGTSEERLAWFRQLRRRDPDRARGEAAAVWKESPAAFRTELMVAVADTVVPSDEAFCEAGLDDRAEGVRVAAAAGLSRLPGSAFVARMAERAKASVRVVEVEPGGIHRLLRRTVRTLRVTPYEPDAAAERDGLVRRLSSGERLNRLVAAVPPAAWPALCGATVADLVAMAQDEPRWDLTAGLVTAVVRHRDAGAADALVAAGVGDIRLVPLLSTEPLLALIGRVPPTLLGTVLEAVPLPWPHELATAVGQQLIGKNGHQVRPEAWALFARAVPLPMAGGWANRLRGLGQPDARTVRGLLRETTAVLTVRAVLYDELRGFLPRQGGAEGGGVMPTPHGQPGGRP